MSPDAMPAETKFDLMADLCILAGQAVMREGSKDLQAAMRVVLGILGQEVAARMRGEGDAAIPSAAARSARPKPRRRAGAGRLASCA